jgi:uncharacterized membrane protein
MPQASDFHLWVNHLPLFAFFFGLLLYFFARKSADIRRAGLWLLVLGGLSGIPAFLSGEPIEEKVEHLPGIQHRLIEEHEEWGERAVWMGGICGLMALAGLVAPIRNKEKLCGLAAALGVLAFLTMAITAHHGGDIRRQDQTTEQAQKQQEEHEH